MAIASGRLGELANGSIVITLAYNDANNAVQSATVANNSPYMAEFTVWLTADPTNRRMVSVPPLTTQTFTTIPAGTRYSPVELAPTDPRATNFDWSFRTL